MVLCLLLFVDLYSITKFILCIWGIWCQKQVSIAYNSTIYDIIIYPMLSADSHFWLANNHEV